MSAENKKNWKCQECVSKKPKTDNTDTPIKTGLVDDQTSSTITLRNKPAPKSQRSPQASPTPEHAGEAAVTFAELVKEIRLLREEMIASRTEMQEFRSAMSRLAADQAICNKKVAEVSVRLEAVERFQKESAGIQNNDFEDMIASLKIDLNDRDQEILCNDIEVAGITEEKNERTLHLAHMISKKLGVPLEERDIVHAERVGAVRRSDAQDGGAPRPRALVVRLARRSQRDQLLAAARVRRGITTADMGLSSSARSFYVNERLTRHNRQLFHKARAEASRFQWKFVWTRDGCIYARKEEGAPRRRLRTEADITKVFV